MAGEEWTKVAAESDLKNGEPISRKVGDKEILLVRVGHRVFACGGKCTHYGAPLADGVMTDHTITCPWHNSMFDVRTGNMMLPPALEHLAQYPVKVENGEIFVGRPTKTLFPKLERITDRTFAIIGAGAAGNAAAETLRREGFDGRIVLITRESDYPYDRPNLSKDYLAGQIAPEWVPLRSRKFYANHHIEVLLNHEVTGLDPGLKLIHFAEGKPLAYDRLLIATGGIPRNQDVPGTDLKGYVLLRTLTDANVLIAAAEQANKAVIVGGGFIGLETAASLQARKVAAEVVIREEAPLVKTFGERIGRFIQSIHEKQGVKFHVNKIVKEIVGTDKVQAVILSDGTRVDTDIVLAGLGITPAVEFLEQTGIVEDGAVPVDNRLQTRVENVFAAGDIAVVPTPPHGAPMRVEHWVVAEREGQHAARTMMGSPMPYSEIPFFWTKQYEYSFRYIGHAERYDRVAYRGNVEEGKFLAGYYQDGSLKAVAGLKMDREIILLGELLKTGGTLAPDAFADERVSLFEFAPHGHV